MLGVSGSLPLIITLYKVICKVTLIIGYIPAIWDVSVYYILQWHFIHFICLKKVLLPVNLLGSNKSMVWNMLKGLWEKTLGAWVWHFQLSLYLRVSHKKCIISIFAKYLSNKENQFQNFFFLLKTEINLQILNTKSFLCDFRGLRYLQNKMGFRNTQVHIHIDLKWS